jgi:hypothetical protein
MRRTASDPLTEHVFLELVAWLHRVRELPAGRASSDHSVCLLVVTQYSMN